MPFWMARLVFGGITYTEFGRTFMPFSICTTGIAVLRWRISESMLLCSGSMWVTTTNPAPMSGGVFLKKVSRASSPPADAPMPVMMKGDSPGASVISSGATALSGFASAGSTSRLAIPRSPPSLLHERSRSGYGYICTLDS